MSIYEVMLYFLSSPFHHAYMKQGKKKSWVGNISEVQNHYILWKHKE